VTHRLQLLSLTKRVIVLHNGRVALDGPTAEVVATMKSARLAPVSNDREVAAGR
jgi:ABC-type protease/lipase transport system fused ATPase/permease subunit